MTRQPSYTIERWGTGVAPWCIVHRGTGLKIPVSRPYPGPETFLPPIEKCNFRSRQEAEKAAGEEIDWAEVDRICDTPEAREAGRRYREKREFDAAYQAALEAARDGKEPWPWQPGGLLHRTTSSAEVVPVQLTFDGQQEAA